MCRDQAALLSALLVAVSERKPYKTDVSDEQWALVESVMTPWKTPRPSVSGHQGRRGVMRQKVPGRKRGLAVDVLGLLIAVVVAAASAHENAVGIALLDMDMEVTPNNINNTRLKLKRLAERGILVETEQGLFTQPRP